MTQESSQIVGLKITTKSQTHRERGGRCSPMHRLQVDRAFEFETGLVRIWVRTRRMNGLKGTGIRYSADLAWQFGFRTRGRELFRSVSTAAKNWGRGTRPQKIQKAVRCEAKVENDIMKKEIGWNGLVVESVPALVEGSIDPRLIGMHSEARSINMALVCPPTLTETMNMRCMHDVAVLTLSRNSQHAHAGMRITARQIARVIVRPRALERVKGGRRGQEKVK
ncbi:hypothetical protein B0H13DRAFT_1904259 [Mycena leptocephala]|nr:hypothetical protein B0H13DRAFT_1904259 [Mycena leptocephala]